MPRLLLSLFLPLAHAFDTTWRAVLFVLDAEEGCWCGGCRSQRKRFWERGLR